MSGGDDDTEKTEEPTPERLRKAREEGQFPRSKDAGPTAGSIAVLVCLAGMGTTFCGILRDLTVRSFTDSMNLMRGDPRAIGLLIGPPLMQIVLPTALAGVVVSCAVGFAEAGFQPNLDLVSPKWSRLDPMSKLGNMFSPKEMVSNITLLLMRVAVVGTVAYYTVKSEFPKLVNLARTDLPHATVAVATAVFRLGVWASAALIAIAALDYFKSWFSHRKRMMMSRQEMKDEMKQSEGDPAMKGRQRARAREMHRKGLAKQVKRADVIIVNPTHVSVALRYRAEEGAPVVTAKGVDEVALYIRELAKKNNIPIVENIKLARALNAQVKAGKAIPLELYKAAAEVLAFVYRLKGKGVTA
jgi:flagellar biosynthetic protein FlhB